MRLVYIEFLDHQWRIDRTWYDLKDAQADAKEPVPVYPAVGFVVEETEEALTITSPWGCNEVGPCFTVLKTCIKHIEDWQPQGGTIFPRKPP